MRANIARLLRAPMDRVNIKARTHEMVRSHTDSYSFNPLEYCCSLAPGKSAKNKHSLHFHLLLFCCVSVYDRWTVLEKGAPVPATPSYYCSPPVPSHQSGGVRRSALNNIPV